MNHAGITSNCAACHTGQTFYGVTPVSKSATHISTGSDGLRKLPPELRELRRRGLRAFRLTPRANAILPRHWSERRHEAGFQSRPNRPGDLRRLPQEHRCRRLRRPSRWAQLGIRRLASAPPRTAQAAISGSYFGVVVKSSTHTTPSNHNCSTGCHSDFTTFAGASYTHSSSLGRTMLHLPRHRCERRDEGSLQPRPRPARRPATSATRAPPRAALRPSPWGLQAIPRSASA